MAISDKNVYLENRRPTKVTQHPLTRKALFVSQKTEVAETQTVQKF